VKEITWETVREIELKLPNTTAGTAWRSPTLEVDGRRFAGVPVHKSAEANSFAIHCDFADRDALIAEQPHIYYTAAHYENYPCVLVRLARINPEAIEDLLRMAHRYESSKPPRRQIHWKERSPSDTQQEASTRGETETGDAGFRRDGALRGHGREAVRAGPQLASGRT